MHSNADNTDTRQFSLRKGDTFALTFSKSLELKLGNAGGVRLRYDGQDQPPAGQSARCAPSSFPRPSHDRMGWTARWCCVWDTFARLTSG